MVQTASQETELNSFVQQFYQKMYEFRGYIFFILVIIFGWFPWYLTSSAEVFFMAPFIAVLIVAAAFGGLNELKLVFKRFFKFKVSIYWYIFILFFPAVVSLIAVGSFILIGGTSPEFPMFKNNQLDIIIVFIGFLLPFFSSAFLEEIGFRAYALPHFQEKYGPLIGTLLVGFVFGAWLLPEFYHVSSIQNAMGIGYYPLFIVTEIAWSIVMTWIYNQTNGSALVSGYLLHGFFNAWTMLLLTNLVLDSEITTLDVPLFQIYTIIIVIFALIIIYLTKGDLAYSKLKDFERDELNYTEGLDPISN